MRIRTAGIPVRREKAALSSGCKPRPANRSSRKQPGQAAVDLKDVLGQIELYGGDR
jgi:hypothetical protein